MSGNSGKPSSGLTPGDRVGHRAHGDGIVRRVEPGGRHAWVAFGQGGAPAIRLPSSELGRLEALPAPPPEPVSTRPSSGGAGQRASLVSPAAALMESRRETSTGSLLEALRLGVIPGSRVGEYTVGRDGLFDQLRRDLDGLEAAGQFMVILGDYGSGKSHALEWLREEALSRGFLTATAELDDREVTWANPKRVYRALVEGLVYPDLGRSAHGLAPLIDRLVRTGRAPLPSSDDRYHRYLDPAVDTLVRARQDGDEDLQQRILDWIGGEPSEDSESWNRALARLRGPHLLALADFRTFSHIYAYLLGGVACRAQEVGYRGLVLLLDEAEFFQALSREDREHASHLIACLALAARGERRVCFDPATLPKGGQPVHRQVPFVYRQDQPLYVVVALTPVDEMRDLLGRLLPLDQVVLELSRLTPRDYQTLFERIVGLYPVPAQQRGLLGELAAPMGKALFAGVRCDKLTNPRAVLRLIVEFLDVLRFIPRRAPRFATDLIGGLFGEEGP
ncbi:MAG: DUF2791 family P-loop domain-containing protein [Candidatus Riflebacteria bacterium]|nr:DUF2791 family P-loop domain-containing protein [Candidatus Riflebacteria bacterium]